MPNGGYKSEYDDMTLWVENFDCGSKAIKIEPGEKDMVGTVACSVARSSYESEEEYDSICKWLCGMGDATGEFITDDDCYYIVIVYQEGGREYDNDIPRWP